MQLLKPLEGHFSIYECPKCKTGFKTRDSDVKHDRTKQCRACSEKPRCTQEEFSMELVRAYPKQSKDGSRNYTFVDLKCPICGQIHSYQAAGAKRRQYTECKECRVKKLFTGKKICTKCNIEKDINEFTSTAKTSSGKYSRCKTCRSKDAKERRKTLDKVEEYGKHAEKTYNITKEAAIKLRQESTSCAICNEAIEWKDRHLDHCHSSGQVREILCPRCNKGLGSFRDSTTFLENAITYLRKHNDTI